MPRRLTRANGPPRSLPTGTQGATDHTALRHGTLSSRLEEDTGCLSAAGENRRALFDEGLRRLPVVLGAAGLHLMDRFYIEQLGQTATFCAVEVALHQAEGDRGPVRQRPGEFHRHSGQLFIGDDTVDKTERQSFVGLDRAPREIELARFGGADQPGQKEAAAEIAGESP
jgi:hypothetical protein